MDKKWRGGVLVLLFLMLYVLGMFTAWSTFGKTELRAWIYPASFAWKQVQVEDGRSLPPDGCTTCVTLEGQVKCYCDLKSAADLGEKLLSPDGWQVWQESLSGSCPAIANYPARYFEDYLFHDTSDEFDNVSTLCETDLYCYWPADKTLIACPKAIFGQ